jgi:hypothetical protein
MIRRLPALASAGLMMVALASSGAAQQRADHKVPRLGYSDFGWFPVSDDFQPPPSGPGPVVSDAAHPYSSNQTGRQPTFRIADLTNPILKPWAAERLKKTNEETRAGKPPYSPRETCWFAGVPGFDVFSRLRPVYFLQAPNQVTIINEGDAQVRRVYLNVPHSRNPKPSWYGESVGHYENGDTLVIDTIGLNDKTFIDNYLTPHTEQLHVVERFKLSPDGKSLELTIAVEDEGAFNVPWSARQSYNQEPQAQMEEAICAENNVDVFNQGYVPPPEAKAPDF